MLISEIFYSVQGEGELTGVPSVFVRTSGCNLRCAWCDTPYASWNPEGETRDLESIVDEVAKHGASHVVLTGGEPMIAKNIRRVADALRRRGQHITIETAGTIAPDGIACDLASLSPKLANSTPKPGSIDDSWIERHEALRLQPEILRQWVDGYDFQLKFVVANESDLAEIQQQLASLERKIAPSKVLLMPEGTGVAQLAARRDWLVELCKEHGYRYCNRLHIELFGNTPGT